MQGKKIAISKIGSAHTFDDKNNQDFVMSIWNLKMVLDGCGSCPFSEIGTRLFAQFILEEAKKLSLSNKLSLARNVEEIQLTKSEFLALVKNVFERLTKMSESDEFYYQNFCFTILACLEFETEFVVLTCGDGYILAQNENEVEFLPLDDGEYPKYYIYNYVREKERLQEYQEGVSFTSHAFSKKTYRNVGVATDGLRFFDSLEPLEKNRFQEYLQEGKKGKIGMLLNRNATIFKDDISICF